MGGNQARLSSSCKSFEFPHRATYNRAVNEFAIVVDSVADLPEELVERFGLTLIPFPVMFGGKSFLDKIDLSPKKFFQFLRSDSMVPSTSAPPPGTYLEAFRRLLVLGKSVLAFTVTARQSAAYQSAMIAKSLVPEGEIEIIDSKSVSMGLGFVAIEAANAVREKNLKEEILSRVQRVVNRIQILAMLPDLKYAERNGRISSAVARVVSFLNIKPIVRIRQGVIELASKASNYRTAMEKMIQKIRSVVGEQRCRLSVIHADVEEEALALRARLVREFFVMEDIPISEVGPALGSHSGPGAIAVAFYPIES
jgi:DegV family protein with EDD domain